MGSNETLNSIKCDVVRLINETKTIDPIIHYHCLVNKPNTYILGSVCADLCFWTQTKAIHTYIYIYITAVYYHLITSYL